MSYWRHASSESFKRIWELITGGTLPLLIGIGIFFLSTLLVHKIRGKELSIEWAWDGIFGLISTSVIGFLLFPLYLVFIYPTHIYHEDQARQQSLVRKEIQIASIKTDLKASQDRATQLSDALNMSNDSVHSGEEIKQLKTELDALNSEKKASLELEAEKEWIPLTQDQISDWARVLSAYHVSLTAVTCTDAHSEALGNSLKQVFERAGWPEPIFMTIGFHKSGLTLAANKDEPAMPIMRRLLEKIADVRLNTDQQALGSIQIDIGEK